MQTVEMYVGVYNGNARTWYETEVEIPADTPPDEVEDRARQALARRLDGGDESVAFVGVMPVWTAVIKQGTDDAEHRPAA